MKGQWLTEPVSVGPNGVRESHAQCVKIPRADGLFTHGESAFVWKNVLAPAVLKKCQKRVDSRNEFRRVRALFTETTTNLEKNYEEIQQEKPGVHAD